MSADAKVLAEIDRHHSWVNRAVQLLEAGSDPTRSNAYSEAMCRHVIELYLGALDAIRGGHPAAAQTLFRPIFEGLLRAYWLHDAPAADVALFDQDNAPSIDKLKPLLVKKFGGKLPEVFQLSYKSKTLLHSFTHGGPHMAAAQQAGSALSDPERQIALAQTLRAFAAWAMRLDGMITLEADELQELESILQEIDLTAQLVSLSDT